MAVLDAMTLAAINEMRGFLRGLRLQILSDCRRCTVNGILYPTLWFDRNGGCAFKTA
tara:strand:- start:511 stop:681 length:171 start_codon:yes stop_codon:yes gene_type:complete